MIAATQLLGNPAWGLISAKLGNSSNIKEFSKKIWPKTGTGGLKKYFEKDYPQPDWNNARDNFKESYKKVQEMRKEIAYAQKLSSKTRSVLERIQYNEKTLLQLIDQLSLTKQTLLKDKGAFTLMQDNCKQLTESIAIFERNIPISVKIFNSFIKKDSRLQDLQKLKDNQTNLIIFMENARAKINEDEASYKNLEQNIRELEHDINKSKVIYENLKSDLDKYSKLFGNNFVNEGFWDDVQTKDKTQISCPWTYSEYDKMREELFYQALILHKTFMIKSNCVKQNLKRLIKMWDGEFNAEDRQAAYGSLLNTLQLIIPVISTSFASVRSFLDNVRLGELGVLVVDEAGQATPQSAVGAIWRTQKAIVVGEGEKEKTKKYGWVAL